MHIPHTIMMNMICVHCTRSSILMTSEKDKWPRSGFRSPDEGQVSRSVGGAKPRHGSREASPCCTRLSFHACWKICLNRTSVQPDMQQRVCRLSSRERKQERQGSTYSRILLANSLSLSAPSPRSGEGWGEAAALRIRQQYPLERNIACYALPGGRCAGDGSVS